MLLSCVRMGSEKVMGRGAVMSMSWARLTAQPVCHGLYLNCTSTGRGVCRHILASSLGHR